MSGPDRMTHDLERFVAAQQRAYDDALAEVRRGRKTGHWIWYVFPQLIGLGRSGMSQFYGIASLDEARDYLAHPVLGPRLVSCASALLDLPASTTAISVFGELDAMKVHSSMTLFHRAAPDEPTFRAVLVRYFDGEADPATDALLGT